MNITCKTCNQIKSYDNFFRCKRSKSGYNNICKSCEKFRLYKEVICPSCNFSYKSKRTKTKTGRCRKCRSSPAFRKRNFHNYWLQSKFGITINQYETLLKNQNGSCAICKRPQEILSRKLCVDHCHKTKKIRGLLCMNCNSAIGQLQDKPDLCHAAANYLLKDGSVV